MVNKANTQNVPIKQKESMLKHDGLIILSHQTPTPQAKFPIHVDFIQAS